MPEPIFDRPQFEIAIQQAQEELGIYMDDSLAITYIFSVHDLKEEYEFEEAMEIALGRCHIHGNRKRSAFKILAGTYFGAHGNKVLASIRRRAAKSMHKMPTPKKNKKKEEPASAPTFELEDNQYVFL